MQNEHNTTESDRDSDSKNERPIETLIHGFTESQCIHDLQDKIVEITPTERQLSLGIFKAKYVEEMNFPTLFFGNPRDDDITKIFSYHKIAQ